MSHVVESATSRRHRRNRRTAIVLVVLVAVLGGAFYYAAQYFQHPPSPAAAACPTADITAGALAGIAPGQVTVNVYNTTGRAGLAADAAKSLKSLGYVIGTVSNDPAKRKIDGVGEMRYGPGGQLGANLLKTVVPGTAFTLDKRADATVDLVIGNGFKSVSAPTATSAPAAAAASPC